MLVMRSTHLMTPTLMHPVARRMGRLKTNTMMDSAVKTHRLKLASFNSRGCAMDRSLYIKRLLNDSDLVLLQETWLFDSTNCATMTASVLLAFRGWSLKSLWSVARMEDAPSSSTRISRSP